MSKERYLHIYLNDHLAGSVAGSELAKRCRASNRGTPLESHLDGLIAEIEEDRAELEAVMERVEARRATGKQWLAWTAEKVARLKLNGEITRYSDLSRVLELEGLGLGIQGKVSLWRTLRAVAASDRRLAGFDFDRLQKRAEQQVRGVEGLRKQAVARAFGR